MPPDTLPSPATRQGNHWRWLLTLLVLLAVPVLLLACGGAPAADALPAPTATPVPTATPAPTATAAPSTTPVPTATSTPRPTLTPSPTVTPSITSTPTPAGVASVPILMYHYIREVDPVADPRGYELSVTPDMFAAQLDWLKSQGYTPIRMDSVARCLEDARLCPPRPIVLTFDDGYTDAYTTALPMLQARGFIGTFYIVNGFIGQPNYMTWDEVRALSGAGMQVGAHSLTHSDLTTLSYEQASTEITLSRRQLESMLGVPVTSFCYPVGQFNGQLVALVRQAGYTSAATTIQGWNYSSPYTLPRIRIHGNVSLQEFAALVQTYTPQ